MKTHKLLFGFDDLAAGKDQAINTLKKYFTQAGNPVVSISVDGKTRRSSGISYREIELTFGDSQTVAMRVKQTGDVFGVLLNGAVVPIKAQDDQVQAVAEISALMDRGRVKFQQKLVKAKAQLPKEIHTAAPKLLVALRQKRDDLAAAVAALDDEIAVYGNV